MPETTPVNTGSSSQVAVISPPKIDSLSPSPAKVGESLTLRGSHLANASQVSFNGVAGTITANTDNELVVTVPAGAQHLQPVVVTTPGGRVSSKEPLRLSNRLYFVNASVKGGAGDGSSWANATPDLQVALGAASPGDQIWIAAGTYRPAGPGGDRNASFVLRSQINVYGGFQGNELQLAERQPSQHKVILSGDLKANDNAQLNPDEPSRADNSYHVVTGASDMLLAGVTIEAGNIESEAQTAVRSGAGLLNQQASPQLQQVVLRRNASADMGGAMANLSASPQLTEVSFSQNLGRTGGGAIANLRGSAPQLQQVRFENNQAPAGQGGALLNQSASASLKQAQFLGNSAQAAGAIASLDSQLTLTEAVFAQNSARDQGGALLNHQSQFSLSNGVFANNRAGQRGGAIYNLDQVQLTLNHCTLVNNQAPTGSGLATEKVLTNSLVLSNSLLWGNVIFHPTTHSLKLSHTSLEGGLASITSEDPVTAGSQINSNNPLFVNLSDPDGPDNQWLTADDGLQLQANSPALNSAAASNTPIDLLNTPRGNAPDRGAYERPSP